MSDSSIFSAKSRIFSPRSETEAAELLRPIFERSEDADAQEVRESVREILLDVRTKGDAGVLKWARSLDGFSGDAKDFRIDQEKLPLAWNSLSSPVREAFQEAKKRICDYHLSALSLLHDQLPAPGQAGFRLTPLDRVGIYVPGGTAAYPSTVLMTALVARVAGVKNIVGVTPAKNGHVPESILAAFHLSGVTEVIGVGGVQGIGALAYGTESIMRVDKIAGPGNRFVAEAKRQVFGLVDIDMIAGPTEVVVIADKTANPRWIAADLLAQAEHDTRSSAILLTDSLALAQETAREMDEMLGTLPRSAIAAESVGRYGYLLVVREMDEALRISDRIAPEHLELHVSDPVSLVPRLAHAGAIFIGENSAEVFGDYMYGPSHVLPTSGSARFSSPVSVETFLKRTSLIRGFGSREEQEAMVRMTAVLARLEGLEGHARSALQRSESCGKEII
ncbi:MAG: histidinol dehydrogenase [Nitrospiraceae bacterium]|nr:histidinol dehydrogenase [Nitrospiraceae bacterium]